jgi:predicted kinase
MSREQNRYENRLLHCPCRLRRRVRQRKGDITDATESVLEMQLPSFEPPTESITVTIDTTKDVDAQLSMVRES